MRGTTRLYRLLADPTASIRQLHASQDPFTGVSRLSLVGWKQLFGQWLRGDVHWIPAGAYTLPRSLVRGLAQLLVPVIAIADSNSLIRGRQHKKPIYRCPW